MESVVMDKPYPVKVEIGSLCDKGPHAGFVTDADYWPCGSHTLGKLYVEFDESTSDREAGVALFNLLRDMSTAPEFSSEDEATQFFKNAKEFGS